MKHEEEWLARVIAWRASGLSAKDYCVDKAFEKGALLAWSSRLGREGKVPPSRAGRKPKSGTTRPSVRFARVVASAMQAPSTFSADIVPTTPAAAAAPSSVTIAVGSSRIEVAPGFDPSLLRAVVDALAGSAR